MKIKELCWEIKPHLILPLPQLPDENGIIILFLLVRIFASLLENFRLKLLLFILSRCWSTGLTRRWNKQRVGFHWILSRWGFKVVFTGQINIFWLSYSVCVLCLFVDFSLWKYGFWCCCQLIVVRNNFWSPEWFS